MIGNRLTELRKQRGLSQAELASMLEVSTQTLSDWETNRACPDDIDTAKICRFFNIEKNDLFEDRSENSSSLTAETQSQTEASNQSTDTITIWRSSIVVSAVLLTVFSAVTALCLFFLLSRRVFYANSMFVITALICGGLAFLMSLVMLIVSCVMYKKVKKSARKNS